MKLRHAFVLAAVLVGAVAPAVDWNTAHIWDNDYGNEWGNANYWTPTGPPSPTRDAIIGYNRDGTLRFFQGHISLTNAFEAVRELLSRADLRLNTSQLNVHGDVSFPSGGGFFLSGSRVYAQTSQLWTKTAYCAESGINYLDIWSGQTLTLDWQSKIVAKNGHIIQATWAYRPGSLICQGSMISTQGASIALTGETFELSDETGSIVCRNNAGRGIELAYTNLVLDGSVEAENASITFYVQDEVIGGLPMLLAKDGGKIHFRSSTPGQLPTITYDSSRWQCEGSGEILVEGTINAEGSFVDPGDFASGTGRGVAFYTENPADLTPQWIGGYIAGDALKNVRTYTPTGSRRTVVREAEFLDPFLIFNNEFQVEECQIPELILQGGRAWIRNENVAGDMTLDTQITTRPWGNHWNYLFMEPRTNLILLQPAVIDGPLGVAGTDFQKFITTDDVTVRAPLMAYDGASLLQNGGTMCLENGADLSDLRVRVGECVLTAQNAITGSVRVSGGAKLVLDTAQATTTMPGFQGGISVDANGTVELKLPATQRDTPLIRTNGLYLNGRLVVQAAAGLDDAQSAQIQLFTGSVTLGPSASIVLPTDWEILPGGSGLTIKKLGP